MELQDVLESASTCRYYLIDEVPQHLLLEVLDATRFAPTGANRQGVRFILVRDPGKRAILAGWYLERWTASLRQLELDTSVTVLPKALADADHFARHLHEVPVLILVCANISDLLPTDSDLDRIGVTAGASVYPAVQNLLLKARDLGLGATLTTNLCSAEADVARLLDIPDGVATAAMIALGYPARPFPRRLSRLPLSEIAFGESFGNPLS